MFVTQTELEIGIRAALGATPMNAAIDVLSGGLRLVGAGLIVGIPASLAINRFLQGLLFEVASTDLSTYLCCAGFIALVGTAACALPVVACGPRRSRLGPAVRLATQVERKERAVASTRTASAARRLLPARGAA